MAGVAAGKANRITSIADARTMARAALPLALFDYIDGGADDEITMAANIEAFRHIGFLPQMGNHGADPDLATELFGTRLSLPVILAPCGLVSAMHPDGPAGAARAAVASGTVSVLSAVAGASPEAVADAVAETAGTTGAGTWRTPGSAPGSGDARGRLWYQLYAPDGRRQWESLIERVEALGYHALVVTIDTPVLGNRQRDNRNGVSAAARLHPRSALRLAAQVAVRPAWAATMGRAALAARRRSGSPEPTVGLVAAGGSPFSWSDIADIRRRWTGPLLVKGVLSPADGLRSVELGCDGVIVSNHGGRQLDGAPATMAVLPAVVDAVGQRGAVLVDGGVRRGSDVVKAVAVGADAVLIGRPYLYGLAAAGTAGVQRVLDILRADMVRTMALVGCPTVSELDRRWIDLPR